MSNVYVIVETDVNLEKSVIGVADNLESVRAMVNEYYGDHVVLSTNDVRDSGIEYSSFLKVKGLNNWDYEVTVTVMYFQLNKL